MNAKILLLLFVLKRSYICYNIICMTVPLNLVHCHGKAFCNVFGHKTLTHAYVGLQLLFLHRKIKKTLMVCYKSYRI